MQIYKNNIVYYKNIFFNGEAREVNCFNLFIFNMFCVQSNNNAVGSIFFRIFAIKIPYRKHAEEERIAI